MIDDDDKKKKHGAQQQSGYREWRGSDVCQRCSGVIGWWCKDMQGDDENELRVI